MIELWHEWNSVHSFKVRVALAAKGLEWVDRRLELLNFEHLRPQYLGLNPNGVVPTLVHDGAVVLESSVICQYLDEAFPTPALMPTQLLQRAACRGWLKYFDDVAHPALRRASFELLYRPQLARMSPAALAERLRAHPSPDRARAFLEAAQGERDEQVLAQARLACERIVARVEDGLSRAEWLSGGAFGMGEVAMAPFAERLDVLGWNALWTLPKARDWADRVMLHASVAKSRAPTKYRLSPAA